MIGGLLALIGCYLAPGFISNRSQIHIGTLIPGETHQAKVFLFYFFSSFGPVKGGGVSAVLLVGPFRRRVVINFNEESQGLRINFSFRYWAERILTTPAVEKTEL